MDLNFKEKKSFAKPREGISQPRADFIKKMQSLVSAKNELH
jgi:hypothetical protein